MPTMANSDGEDTDLLADTGSHQQPPRVPGGNDDDIGHPAGGHGYGGDQSNAITPLTGLDEIRRAVNFDTPMTTIMGQHQQQQRPAVRAAVTTPQEQQQQQSTATPAATQQTGVSSLRAAIRAAYGGAATAAANTEMVTWQVPGKTDKNEWVPFREQVAACSCLLICVARVIGSPYLRVIHSIARYTDPTAPAAERSKVIGFVGDRVGNVVRPMTVLLPDGVWDWKDCKKVVVSPVEQAAHFAQEGNRFTLWNPTDRSSESRQMLPKLLLIPPCLMDFIVKESRTPWELHSEIERLLGLDNPPVTATQADLMLDWCRCAAQVLSASDTSKSSIAVTVDPVMNVETAFQTWGHNRLEVTLGPVMSSGGNNNQAGPVLGAPQSAIAGTATTQSLEHIAGIIQHLHQTVTSGSGGGGGIAGANLTATTRKKLDEWDIAAIKGFSHLTDTTKVQAFWKTTQGVRNNKVIRQELDRGMELWSQVTGAEIEQGRYFPEDILNCIIKVDFCPGEPVPTFATVDKGLGPLPCRPWTSGEIEADQSKEKAAEQTAATRTYNEWLQLEARPPKNPPATLLELRIMIATFCALLWTLFGDQCDLYKKCFDIYLKLKDKYIAMQSWYFSSHRCREITWAIIVDSRRYFSERLHPSALMAASPAFPQSYLGTVLVNIQEMNAVKRGEMPLAWQNLSNAGLQAAPVPGGQMQKLPLSFSHAPLQHPVFLNPQVPLPPAPTFYHPTTTAPTPTPTVAGSGGYSGNTQDPVAHVHPEVRAVFQPYWKKYGLNVAFTEVMNAAGCEWEHIPYLKDLWDKKKQRSLLCYKHLCGQCPKKNCPLGKVGGHVAYTDSKVQPHQALFLELAGKLKPGVDYVVRNGLPQQNLPNKKQKTWGGGGFGTPNK